MAGSLQIHVAMLCVILRYTVRGAGVVKASRSTCHMGYQPEQWRNGPVFKPGLSINAEPEGIQ